MKLALVSFALIAGAVGCGNTALTAGTGTGGDRGPGPPSDAAPTPQGGSGGTGASCTVDDCKGQPITPFPCIDGTPPAYDCQRASTGCRWSAKCPLHDAGAGGATDGRTTSGSSCRTDADCRLFDDYCSGCDCRALLQSEPDPRCSGRGVTCLRQPCADRSAACDQGRCTVVVAVVPHWRTTCGDPVCRGWTAKSAVPLCTVERADAPCPSAGQQCDPKDACNRLLLCDPSKGPTVCPK